MESAQEAQIGKGRAIEEMTRLLVEFYRPVRIYLFGSEGRGEAREDRDLDFLVVVPDETPESLIRSSEVYSRLSDSVSRRMSYRGGRAILRDGRHSLWRRCQRQWRWRDDCCMTPDEWLLDEAHVRLRTEAILQA
jgi:predicted nucleotidyltransferase